MLKLLTALALTLFVSDVPYTPQLTPPPTVAEVVPALTAEELLWIDESQLIRQLAVPHGWWTSLTIQRAGGVADTPARVSFWGFDDVKLCAFTVIVDKNPLMNDIFRNTTKDDKSMIIQTILAHEVGHCAQFQLYESTMARTKEEYEASNQMEGFADVYALAWAAQHYPEKYDTVVEFFVHMRITLNTSKQSKGLLWKPSYVRYDTKEFIARAQEIKKLSQFWEPEKIALYITTGAPLK